MTPDEAETAIAVLLERFPAGLEEERRGDLVELAVYADAVGEEVLRDIFHHVESAPIDPGWEDRWREFHRPVSAGGLWIGPPWLDPPSGATAVVVDPGRAFGTGAHPTTRASIELLATLERGSLVDAGCGSGVVAVAACRLGFWPVFAVDSDEVAVEVATETVRRNEVAVDVWQLDVLRGELPVVDVVVANIQLRAVEQLLAGIAVPVAVTSGYLASEAPSAPGWKRVDRLELEGWAADVFAKRH